jgi:hypothetical protein
MGGKLDMVAQKVTAALERGIKGAKSARHTPTQV